MNDESNTTVDRRSFLGTVAAAAGGLAFVRPSSAEGDDRTRAERPNIVFIAADDLGYGDLSGYGRADYQTPVLDRLAAQGTRFTQAYAIAPVCTPTRVGFMTGRCPARHAVGLREPLTLSPADAKLGLNPEHPTVTSLLKTGGYTNALVGKWHLGVYWRTTQRINQGAVRQGTWKYLRDENGEYLFDLALDPGERQDRRTGEPQTFERLKPAYAAWERTMLRPVPLAGPEAGRGVGGHD